MYAKSRNSQHQATLARVHLLAMRAMLSAGGSIKTPSPPPPPTPPIAADAREYSADRAERLLAEMPPLLAARLRRLLPLIDRGPSPIALAASPAAAASPARGSAARARLSPRAASGGHGAG